MPNLYVGTINYNSSASTTNLKGSLGHGPGCFHYEIPNRASIIDDSTYSSNASNGYM